MAEYEVGDYVKAEFKDEESGKSEWMWVHVESADDATRLVFGRLDNQPVVNPVALQLGQRIAVSYDKIRQHKKSWEFIKH